MDAEKLAELDAMARITRARMDVIERALATFMANSDRDLAELIEDQFRHYIERGISSDDPAEAEKLHLADQAALRFADLLAQAMARPRG